MNHPYAIAVQDLRQGYGKQIVLNGISLEVPHGQTFALLGRNGAGKTTLIRTLLGLLRPNSGVVTVLGMHPHVQPIEVRRRIGYLAEDQAMYGWMTADELGRFLKPFYPTWDARMANDLLDRFGVPRSTRIKHLSKGQNVRLGLVLALSHQSEVVILDDPALGLDPISRKQFNRDIIEYLQAEKRTVFYSSHLLDEVEAVTLRQSLPLCIPGLLLACIMTFFQMDVCNPPTHGGFLRHYTDSMSSAAWVVGILWSVVVGAGVFAAEIDFPIGEFWRVWPVPFWRLFAIKFFVGLLAVLLVLDGTTIATSWNSPNWGDSHCMNWPYIACIVPLHATMFAIAAAWACLLRRPVLGGMAAIGSFMMVNIGMEWWETTR
ncbi:MAG: ABC transporter ATP-binding protein, partial [Thermoguttaceae bacterium]